LIVVTPTTKGTKEKKEERTPERAPCERKKRTERGERCGRERGGKKEEQQSKAATHKESHQPPPHPPLTSPPCLCVGIADQFSTPLSVPLCDMPLSGLESPASHLIPSLSLCLSGSLALWVCVSEGIWHGV
jgi:hypothetical protein